MSTIQTRRGTAASATSNNPILASGEHGFETDTGKEKIGDGVTAWTSLPYTTDLTRLPSSVVNASAGTGAQIPVANGSGGFSWLPETFVGKAGSRYAVIAAPIQNNGSGSSYWQPITISSHEPCNIDSITTTSGVTGQITINYPSINALDVVTFLVSPDETLANAGFFVGGSVGLTLANLNVARVAPISDFISYNGTTWVFSKGASSPFTFGSYTTGVLNITHASLGNSDAFNISVDARGHAYDVVISTTAGVGATSFNLEFWDPATNTLVTTPTTNMKVFVSRMINGQQDPQLVDTTKFPSSNFWVYGIMRTT